MRPRLLNRRKFLVALGGSALTAAGGAAYVRWGEPHWLEVHRVAVPLARDPGAGPALRILQLSDFHLSPVVSLEFIADAIALGLTQRPDLIVVTGDFFTNRLDDAARYAEVLARLSAAAPTFACLGNHDGGPWTQRVGGNATIDEARALLRAARIACLHNDSLSLTVKGRPLQLIGVGDLWSGMCDPATAFARTPPRGRATRILLNHNPDAKDRLRPFDWDLVLCGHTHGGQLRLPFLGTPFAPVADKRFVEGLHRWQERWLYVTRGVGNLHGVRFNCRPQVSVLDLA
jgi:predicted MPP superfamily phosphohydrolase